MKYTVIYKGFLQTVSRTFKTKEQAETWARKVGRHGVAKIKAEGK